MCEEVVLKTSPFSVFRQFLWLGCTSFGGPVAHIGIFRRQFVEKEQRLSDSDYASLVAVCQIIPGPASSQVGMGLGYRFAGWAGAFAAWLGFTLPSAVLMLCAALWILYGGVASDSAWVITAMKLVAVGIVTQAVIGMWKQLCTDRETKIVALIAVVAFYSMPTAIMQVGLILAALIGGYMRLGQGSPDTVENIMARQWNLSGPLLGIGLWGIGIVFAVTLSDSSIWSTVFAGHYTSGALVFGGGHVVLPLLEAEFVPPLEISTFLAGYGFAQAMPGPLFTIASYLGAVTVPESPIIAALIGVIAIFLPGAILLAVALSFGSVLEKWKDRFIYVNAVVVGLLFAVLINPVFTEAVYSEATTALAILSLFICIALKRSPLELVIVMMGAAYICHLLEWI
jgi:chromate transporter